MENIVVTGSSGFVGKNLESYLLSNHRKKIIPFLRKNWETISTINFLHNTAIVHLVGKAHDLKKVSRPEEYYQVNTELTKTLFDKFLTSNAEVFIFISSVKAAADSIESILTEETTPCPISDYGKSKAMAEHYILSNIPLNKRVYILRPSMIHGPGNKGNLNLLYNVVKKGIPWPLGAFDNKRSFCSVVNLCFIINELINRSDIPSGIFNVCDDTPISTNTLISLMSDLNNRKPKILRIPKNLIMTFATIGDKLGLPLNTERLQKLTENFVVSNIKITKALNKQLPLTAENGLIETLKSFS